MAKVDLSGLRGTKLGWKHRGCGDTVVARSKVLNEEVTLCSADADRVNTKTGGMTLSGIQGGHHMARKTRRCKFGVVKSGPRKGMCRLKRVVRRRKSR